MLLAQLYAQTYQNPTLIDLEFAQLYAFLNGNISIDNLGLTFTAGAVVYSTATGVSLTGSGTSGMALLSAGSGAPTWGTLGLKYGGTGIDLTGTTFGQLIYAYPADGRLANLTQGTSGLPVLSGGVGGAHTYGILSLAAGGTAANLSSGTTNAVVTKGASALQYSALIFDGTSLTGATNVAGTLTTAAQTNITSLGEQIADFLPHTDNFYNLGSGAKRWATVYAVNASGTTVTGSIGLDAGSVTSPSLYFSSDTGLNTGLYWVGQGQIGITSDGTQRLLINNSGISVTGTITGTIGSATQNSITTMTGLTTVGTISTGTWNSTVIGLQYGGTSANLTGGTASGIVTNNSSSTALRITAVTIDTSNNMSIGGTLGVSGVLTASSRLTINNTNPQVRLEDNDSSTSEKNWVWDVSSTLMSLQLVNDPYNAHNNIIEITRSGFTLTSIAFLSSTGSPLLTITGTAITPTVKFDTYLGIGGNPTSTIGVYLALASLTYGMSLDPGWTAGVAAAYGMAVGGHTASSGTITNLYTLLVSNSTINGSAAITNKYGLYIEAISGGGTLNYAIYTNAGLVHFAGAVDLSSKITVNTYNSLFLNSETILSGPHITLSNTDNTTDTAWAQLKIITGGSSGGDPYIWFTTTTTSWSFGIDNSVANDPMVWSASSNLATSAMTLTTVGALTLLAGLTCTTITASGAVLLNGAVTLGDASADNITITGTITSNLIFTDNVYDIGSSGSTRPRDIWMSRYLYSAGATSNTNNTTDNTIRIGGGQIFFPSNQASSTAVNCLDDYQEGTFTPKLKLGTTEVTSYSSLEGLYTKVGNTVHVLIRCVVNAVGAGTGDVTLDMNDIPYNANIGASSPPVHVFPYSLVAAFAYIFGQCNNGSKVITLWQMSILGAEGTLPHTQIQTGTQLNVNFSFMTSN